MKNFSNKSRVIIESLDHTTKDIDEDVKSFLLDAVRQRILSEQILAADLMDMTDDQIKQVEKQRPDLLPGGKKKKQETEYERRNRLGLNPTMFDPTGESKDAKNFRLAQQVRTDRATSLAGLADRMGQEIEKRQEIAGAGVPDASVGLDALSSVGGVSAIRAGTRAVGAASRGAGKIVDPNTLGSMGGNIRPSRVGAARARARAKGSGTSRTTTTPTTPTTPTAPKPPAAPPRTPTDTRNWFQKMGDRFPGGKVRDEARRRWPEFKDKNLKARADEYNKRRQETIDKIKAVPKNIVSAPFRQVARHPGKAVSGAILTDFLVQLDKVADKRQEGRSHAEAWKEFDMVTPKIVHGVTRPVSWLLKKDLDIGFNPGALFMSDEETKKALERTEDAALAREIEAMRKAIESERGEK